MSLSQVNALRRAASRTHLSQVSDVGQRIIWSLWHRLEQCVRRSLKFYVKKLNPYNKGTDHVRSFQGKQNGMKVFKLNRAV